MKPALPISVFLVLCMVLGLTTTPALARSTSSSLEEKVDAYYDVE